MLRRFSSKEDKKKDDKSEDKPHEEIEIEEQEPEAEDTEVIEEVTETISLSSSDSSKVFQSSDVEELESLPEEDDEEVNEERVKLEKRVDNALEKIGTMTNTYQNLQKGFDDLSHALEESGEITRAIPSEPSGSETGHLPPGVSVQISGGSVDGGGGGGYAASPQPSRSHGRAPSPRPSRSSRREGKRSNLTPSYSESTISESMLPILLAKMFNGDKTDKKTKLRSKENKAEYIQYLTKLITKFQKEAQLVFQLALLYNNPEEEQDLSLLMNLLLQEQM